MAKSFGRTKGLRVWLAVQLLAIRIILISASWNVGGDPSDRITMPAWEEYAPEHDKDKDGLLKKDEIPAGPIRDRYPQIDLDKNGVVTKAEWENMRDMFARAGNAVLAIRPGGKGNVSQTHLAWKSTRSLPYVSSPLLYQNRVYTVKNGGLASCYNAETGEAQYQDERLGANGDYYSSAVAANDRVYVASQAGVVVVHKAGDTLKILAKNNLHEEIFATPFIYGRGRDCSPSEMAERSGKPASFSLLLNPLLYRAITTKGRKSAVEILFYAN